MSGTLKRMLFLDDSRERQKRMQRFVGEHDLITSETAEQAIALLDTVRFDVAFLDHDLGEGDEGQSDSPENSGMTVVNALIAKASRDEHVPLVVVHTLNGPRGDEMCRRLKAGGVYHARRMFTLIDEEVVRGALQVAEVIYGEPQ